MTTPQDLEGNQSKKTFLNMSYVYLVNVFHLFAALFPYPLRSWIFSLALKKMGARSSLDWGVYIKFPNLVSIGSGVSVNRGVQFFPDFFGKCGVELGDGVRVGPFAKFYCSGHDITDPTLNTHVGGKISVGNGAWVGASSIILPGVTIGENAIIGAGSVVTKDVPANMIYAGNPAALIRERG